MYFVYFLTTLIVAFHLLDCFQSKLPILRIKLTLPFLPFLFSQIISTFISVDPHTSIFGYYSRLHGGLLSTLAYFLLFAVLTVRLDDSLRRRLINLSLLSSLLVSLYGLAQHFGIDAHLWVQDVRARVFSTFGQPNWLAAYLCLLLPLALDRLLCSKNKLQITVYSLLITSYYLCLLFTKSKSGLAAAAISLGLYFLLRFFQSKKISTLQITVYGLLITLSLIINNPIKDKLFPPKLITENSKIENLNITPSQDIRQIVWTGAIDLWKKYPLFGTGVETFAYSYYWTRPAAHNLTSEWDFLYNKAHNEYLNFLATSGAFGLATYLVLILVVMLNLFQHPALFCSYLSILITNFSGFSVVVVALYFFLLPLFAFPSFSPAPTRPRSAPFPFKLLIFGLVFFSLRFITFSFLADVSYALSQESDRRSDFDSSYIQAKTAVDYRPDEPLYRLSLATAAAHRGLTNEAVANADLALSISPANINFWKEKAQVYYYLSVSDSKYYPFVIDSLQKASRLAPTDARIFYLLGKFSEIIDKNQAISYHQQAIALKPNYDFAYFDLGVLLFNQKKYSDAKTNFENVLKYAPANTDAPEYLKKIKN